MYKAIIKTKKGIVTYNIQNTNELNKICEQPYDEIRIEHEITKEDLKFFNSQDKEELVIMCISRENQIKYVQRENKQLKRDKNIMQNYLELIINIGYDYDGYNDVKNLKELIDELCKYALYGIKLDDKKIISSSCEKYYNILGEEILGDKENE